MRRIAFVPTGDPHSHSRENGASPQVAMQQQPIQPEREAFAAAPGLWLRTAKMTGQTGFAAVGDMQGGFRHTARTCDTPGDTALSARLAFPFKPERRPGRTLAGRRMRNVFLVASFTIFAGLAQPRAIQAQNLDEQWRWCGQENEPDLAIRGCTTVIQSGLVTRQTLAIAFKNRGDAYMRRGDCGRAIEDYDQSLRLGPDSLPAVASRGICQAARGQRDAATRDYDRATHLQPKDAFDFN